MNAPTGQLNVDETSAAGRGGATPALEDRRRAAAAALEKARRAEERGTPALRKRAAESSTRVRDAKAAYERAIEAHAHESHEIAAAAAELSKPVEQLQMALDELVDPAILAFVSEFHELQEKALRQHGWALTYSIVCGVQVEIPCHDERAPFVARLQAAIAAANAMRYEPLSTAQISPRLKAIRDEALLGCVR